MVKKIKCKICNKEFDTYEPEKRKTCSKLCRNKYISKLYKGKKNPEHSEKMKGKYIGRKLSKETIKKRQETRMNNNGYNFLEKTKEKMSISQKLNHKNKIIYGMKNKLHSIKTKNQISKTKKIDPYRPTDAHKDKLSQYRPTDAHKDKLSQLMKRKIRNNKEKYGTSFPPEIMRKIKINNAQRGKKCQLYSGKSPKVPHYNKYQGIVIAKSSYEKKLMEQFDKEKIDWLYEPKTFILSNGKCYTPDFYLVKEKKYIEAKGFLNKIYIDKYNLFKKEYPKIKIELWTKEKILFDNYKSELQNYKKYKRVKIKKIEEIVYNDYVYDIEVKDCPYFFANNIISHNSTFDMGIDDEIKYMYFFKGKGKEDKESDKEMDSDDFVHKGLELLKKNYIYVTKEGKVKIKNLGIRKKSNSELSRKIFWEFLVPEIKKGKIKFSKAYLKKIMDEILLKDIGAAALRKSVGTVKQYAQKSPNSLPAQIAKKHGSGIHFLIPNTAGVGVGKGKSYCTIEEFKERKLRIEHIDLSNVWRELGYFTAAPIIKDIFSYDGK